ncbi:hypothetical protein H7K45_30670 [Mycobacterium yunnanensis]|uniref:GLTT repeat-containing protein n=1 Tax=Mycobacterium yunnanensis TaxID=368477 RepID=A0A9X3BWQ5_9MYCO|nr:hypothetical protein [Mycobacterium yunnanensis]MCV7424909.1 hypothetical protein [Mycobacterium yunnanensis]
MSTHLRIAAGACVLSTGFMIAGAGGAVAAAEPDSDASTPSTSTGTAHGPVGTFADNVRKSVETSLHGTVQGVTGTLNTLTKPGQIQSNIPKSPKTTFGGSPTVYGSTAPATDTAPDVATAPDAATTPVDPSTSPVEQSTAPVAAPASQPSPSVNKDPIAPVAKAVTSLGTSLSAVPGVVAGLPTSVTPVSDVLTSIQNVLTSVNETGNSLATVPSDLAGLLGVGTGVTTPTIGAAATGLTRARVVTPDPATPVWSAAPDLPTLLAAPSGPVAAVPAAPVLPLDVATHDAVSPATEAPAPAAAPEESPKSDVLSTVEHVIGAVVATVSLTALAAVALPGILGLLTTCAAGIRVGYRQAKAASSLPDTALARFVGSGPVGVVRSRSQVELRSRATRLAPTATQTIERRPALRVVGSESAATQVLDTAV